jgi:hypothetical protein
VIGGGTQQIREYLGGIKLALLNRAEDVGEHFLRAAVSAVAATDLRETTAGRSACSARQFVASTEGSSRKLKTAGKAPRA